MSEKNTTSFNSLKTKYAELTQLSLMQTHASKKILDDLYQAGHIQQDGKFQGQRFINKHYAIGEMTSTVFQYLGLTLFTLGALLFFIQKWPMQTFWYQALTIQLMMIFSIWAAFRRTNKPFQSRIFIFCALILSLIGSLYLTQVHQSPYSYNHLVQVAVLLLSPWLIIIKNSYRYSLLAVIFGLAFAGVLHA